MKKIKNEDWALVSTLLTQHKKHQLLTKEQLTTIINDCHQDPTAIGEFILIYVDSINKRKEV